LRLAQESKPYELEQLERHIMTIQIELESLKNETDAFSIERRETLERELQSKREDISRLTKMWHDGTRFWLVYRIAATDALFHRTCSSRTDKAGQEAA
jgi:ATP-dependent Clp protease ATP-binding subunit ClpA